ncbi:MAG: ABC transporter ATP-binding protein [Acidobacteria bacterium]|nr:ABC transporter ATP-binding protein [Acidobacteriota bacterium]
MLLVRNLRKVFSTDKGEVHAVDDVSFEIKEGEYYTLLGPSGCGKTTTLQCIAGLETPDEGEISMGGELVFSSGEKVAVPAHRREIGMVFQSYAIWPHMTVFDNVAFPLAYGRRRVSKSQVSERVMNALSLVHLQELATRPAPFLSGGQQQRVALARAIVEEPKLLLLDEPLSNLDAKLREEMRSEIRELVSRLQITTLYVTHDQIEALFLSDRIAVMQSGKIVQEGTPRQIFLTPKDQFVADFLGKSNFLKGQVVERSIASQTAIIDTAVGRMRCVITQDVDTGDAVLLAVRPSGIQVRRTAPSEDGNTFQGNIQTLNFIGDFLECLVKTGDELVKVMLDPYQEFKVGEQVYLHVPSDRLVTIAKL